MNDTTKYVGLDVSKDKIAVAVADEGPFSYELGTLTRKVCINRFNRKRKIT
ncbi:hypothetical protein SAMN05216389_10724 [Oceanobacillus limi]|uniref:Transposase n=1 Tax=Oceanobacillus limi TaxID=930131 RepID=A0A1I0CRX4_9BACI|nr:hypothetical protein [Oceanobacillus limi]SET21812.1 hypothetical protein SAMN05216389_10724 [Oceanobacillus limi]